ncbi:MAG: penicillin-binding protein activator [Deltaproteobacteria bacterium]
MSLKHIFSRKAIPAFMAGLAFFLAQCQPKAPPQVKVEPIRPDPLAMAEEYRKEGKLNEALESYQAYIKHHPFGEQSALCLNRMADVYLVLDHKEKAIDALRRIEGAFPDYTALSETSYQLTELQYQTGHYDAAKDEGLKWVKRFPSDPRQREMGILLGDTYRALKDGPEAFKWWLKARIAYPDTTTEATKLDETLTNMVEESGAEALEKMTTTAAGSSYAPLLYFRLSSLYLKNDNLPAAQQAATRLIESTEQARWISAGKDLLRETQERMAVSPGVVGCLLPLTGPFAIYGKEALNGIVLGSGIPSGSEADTALELVIRDTKSDPREASQALEELADKERVMAVIGPLSSKTAVDAAETAQKLGVPIITLTHKQGVQEIGEMVFRHLLSPAQEIDALLEVAMGQIGFDRFAVLYPDDPYGRYCMTLFRDGVIKRGGAIRTCESYNTDETDFADPIRKMVHLDAPQSKVVQERLAAKRIPEVEEETILPEAPAPVIDFDAIFIPDSFQRVAMIAPQLAFHDILGVRLMGTSAWQSPELLKQAGDYIQEAFFPSGFFKDAQTRGINAFVSTYRAYFDAAPGTLAATAYDTISLLKRVMDKHHIQTRNALKDALLAYRGWDGLTGSIHFTPQGEAIKRPAILTVSGHAFIQDPLFSYQPGTNEE